MPGQEQGSTGAGMGGALATTALGSLWTAPVGACQGLGNGYGGGEGEKWG